MNPVSLRVMANDRAGRFTAINAAQPAESLMDFMIMEMMVLTIQQCGRAQGVRNPPEPAARGLARDGKHHFFGSAWARRARCAASSASLTQPEK